jgi:hypothetical protein
VARLGETDLSDYGSIDSGVALLLARPAKVARTITRGAATVHISPEASLVVCSFRGATSHVDALQMGTGIIQECLDIISMTGGPDLVTRDARDEYFVWWSDAGKRTISAVSTSTLSLAVPPATVEVRDAAGNLVPQIATSPMHHLGFRFYRLSQVSDNLFDSYRNMYLAFEALLSGKYPKGRERERDWLRRSLTSGAPDLHLGSLAPPSYPVPVDHVITTIYDDARLPLFHAKDGHAYYAPSVSNRDQAAVAAALEMLTSIVIKMADVWYQTRRVGGMVYPHWVYENIKRALRSASFVASTSGSFSQNEDLEGNEARSATHFDAIVLHDFDGEGRVHAQGALDLPTASLDGPVRVLRLINDQCPMVCHVLETPLDPTGFDRLEAIAFLRVTNASQPRELFSR